MRLTQKHLLKKPKLIAVHRYALTADPIETRLQSHTHP
jgi:hypothetical protein